MAAKEANVLKVHTQRHDVSELVNLYRALVFLGMLLLESKMQTKVKEFKQAGNLNRELGELTYTEI